MTEPAAKMERLVQKLRGLGYDGDLANAERFEANRVAIDQCFGKLMELLGPRVRRLTRRYGLWDAAEDAWQACAIGVHRAVLSYEPSRASFSTHVTWQLRGELQSLRHRLHADQRQSARTAGIRTVSMEVLNQRSPDDATDFEMMDELALSCSERAASDYMASEVLHALLDRLEAPEHERMIVFETIFSDALPVPSDHKTREQRRQIARRTFRNCAKLLAA